MSDAIGVAMPATVPGAGWYQDPSSTGQLRWWSGAAWTEHARPKPELAPAPIPRPASAMPATPPDYPVPSAPQFAANSPAQQFASASPSQQFAPTLTREATYTGFSQSYSPVVAQAPDVPLGSPNTAQIWFLALLPFILLPVRVVQLLSNPSPRVLAYVAAAAIVTVVGLVLRDRAALRHRELPVASPWWLLLLPPLAYFIARGSALKKVGVRNNAPGNVYVLSVLGAAALLVFVVLPYLGLALV